MIGGAAALFVANALSGTAMLIVVPVFGTLWPALMLEGAVQAWRWRSAGIPAFLFLFIPVISLPFAAFAANHALYWSHVAPSWLTLRSDRAAFDAALIGGSMPTGITGMLRAPPRTAFRTIIGFDGDWAAIVHDPTDRMAAARGWNGGPVAPDIRRSFPNSHTIWCQRLDSHWFHCQFG
ncbi:hypothetical protein ASE57_12575 [Sphingomonas sp. Leaf11]|nr:hypothetical protein ASE58_12570 [Sphingomonas sp. Leaf9]KQM42949.1 hypothetical protein ASE57_12575 [Sphingomonas sp. Leaf11]